MSESIQTRTSISFTPSMAFWLCLESSLSNSSSVLIFFSQRIGNGKVCGNNPTQKLDRRDSQIQGWGVGVGSELSRQRGRGVTGWGPGSSTLWVLPWELGAFAQKPLAFLRPGWPVAALGGWPVQPDWILCHLHDHCSSCQFAGLAGFEGTKCFFFSLNPQQLVH